MQLFYLCADVCQQTTAKDSRGLGKDIWNIFLDRNAVRMGAVCLHQGPCICRGWEGNQLESQHQCHVRCMRALF